MRFSANRLMMLKPLVVFSCVCLVTFLPSLQWKIKSVTDSTLWGNRKGRSVGKAQTRTTNSSSVQVTAVNARPSQPSDKRPRDENSSITTDDGGYPTTVFTPHIEKLLELVDLEHHCVIAINLTVAKPYSVPIVQCPTEGKMVTKSWCAVLKQIFLKQRRILPNSVTLSFSRSDKANVKHGHRCFESSAPDGEFCMMDYLEAERMKDGIEYPIILWENRSSVPIWRGTPWMNKGDDNIDPTEVYEDALSRSPRLQVVAWSYHNPNLLDAKISSLRWIKRHPYWEKRAVNGLDKLFPSESSSIPPEQYYTQYQVAVVLGGIGAAFRLSIHLSTETAVVLQEWEFKEWFTPMMKPFEHYIPLAEDLSDLDETMHWIAEHPTEVRDIARNGREFYERYLSFEKNQEHIAELAFRMALLKSQRDNEAVNRAATRAVR